MKYVWLVSMLIFLLSCKSKYPFLVETCPENGTCSFEVLQKKTLTVLKDNLGMAYPEIGDGNQLVLKFKFEKNTDMTLADGHYVEEIFIELNPHDLEKETTQLKSENLLFARLCFCRGQTGYYRIRTGNLSVKKIKDKTYQIDFNFKIDEVPQMITSISEIFVLK